MDTNNNQLNINNLSSWKRWEKKDENIDQKKLLLNDKIKKKNLKNINKKN
jgi:hypothetical protein